MGAFATGRAVGEANGKIQRNAIHIEQFHNPAAGGAQHLDRTLGMFVACQHHCRRPPSQHRGDERFFPCRVVVGDGENRLMLVLFQRSARAPQDIGKNDIGKRGDDKRDETRDPVEASVPAIRFGT